MNIFFVDRDPEIAAQQLVDKHVVKMILESAQLLSTAHRVLDGEEYTDSSSGRNIKRWKLFDQRENVLYKATHINVSSAIWCRSSIENYSWLVEHFFGLIHEYNYRYDKWHKCYGDLSYLLQSPPKNLDEYDFTEPPCVMDKEFIISSDPVENYRNYYRNGKSDLHSWKNREKPEWLA